TRVSSSIIRIRIRVPLEFKIWVLPAHWNICLVCPFPGTNTHFHPSLDTKATRLIKVDCPCIRFTSDQLNLADVRPVSCNLVQENRQQRLPDLASLKIGM